MLPNTFKALLVEKTGDAPVTRRVAEQPMGTLPAGEVLIQVGYSSLNYKDTLSATGHPGVMKIFPHTVPAFQAGDAVIVTGFDLGMNTWGGFAEYVRVPAAWVVPLPQGMT